MAHDLMLYRQGLPQYANLKTDCYQDSLVVDPAFEISLIFGRSLLNFLGLGLDLTNWNITAKPPQQRPNSQTQDYTIRDLFPERPFCSPDNPIIVSNSHQLCTLYKLADKSVAHLTSAIVNSEDHNELPSARKAIYDLVLESIPEINKQKIWWHTQVASR